MISLRCVPDRLGLKIPVSAVQFCVSALKKGNKIKGLGAPPLIIFSSGFPDCAQNCARDEIFLFCKVLFLTLGSPLQVLIIDDIIPFENRPGFVTGDLHGHSLRNTGPYHIAYGSSAKIMK